MKRHEWTFQRKASVLADTAHERADHHLERVRWWQTKYDATMVKVKESGIDVHEAVAQGYSNKAHGFGPQIVIDETLQRDLAECHTKLKEHNAKRQEYLAWVSVLRANSEQTLELHHDDFIFFFPTSDNAKELPA